MTPWRGLRVAGLVTDVLAPLQGFFFPYNAKAPIIEDYHALFGDPLNPVVWRAPRVLLTAPPAWGGVQTEGPVAGLLHYRINRLHEMLAGAAELEHASPGISTRIQLYVDAHIPMVVAMGAGRRRGSGEALLRDVDGMPQVPSAAGMDHVLEHVARALVSVQARPTGRRNARREVTLACIMRWTLPRELHQRHWDRKTRSFKTLSSDFAEFFKTGGDVLHTIVLCSLFGNHEGASSRPNWDTRLRLYRAFQGSAGGGAPGWLARCDYIIYYALRETIVAILPKMLALRDSVSAIDGGAMWEAHAAETRTIMDRVRSALNEYYGAKGLSDINDTLRNRHNRIGRSVATEPRAPEAAPTAWSETDATPYVAAMVERGCDCADPRAPALVAADLPHVGEGDITNDLAFGTHIQRCIRTTRLPVHHASQLHGVLRRGCEARLKVDDSDDILLSETACVSEEDARLRTTAYVCPCCVRLMNNVVGVGTNPKEVRLRFLHVIRIDIDDETGSITRHCDSCLNKRPGVALPLIEIPLFAPLGRPRSWALTVNDTCVMFCPNCTMLVSRSSMRFGIGGDEIAWGCSVCSPLDKAPPT